MTRTLNQIRALTRTRQYHSINTGSGWCDSTWSFGGHMSWIHTRLQKWLTLLFPVFVWAELVTTRDQVCDLFDAAQMNFTAVGCLIIKVTLLTVALIQNLFIPSFKHLFSFWHISYVVKKYNRNRGNLLWEHVAEWEQTGLGVRGQSDPSERLDAAMMSQCWWRGLGLSTSFNEAAELLLSCRRARGSDQSGNAAGVLLIRTLH